MRLDELTGDGQAEAQATVLARGAAVRLPERVEHVRQELGFDAGAAVLNGQDEPVFPRQPDIDLAVRRRELDGVREQVPDHLLQAIGIAQRHGRRTRCRRRAAGAWPGPPA